MQKRWRCLLACATLALTASPISAQGVEDISAQLAPYRSSGNMPALAGAVFRGGTLVALGATGVRKQGDARAVTTADAWHLGSDIKAMTATLLGIAVDEGTLHFSDTVEKLFPGEVVDKGYAHVTLDQLLQHRGGFPADVPEDIWKAMWREGARPEARLRAVKALLALPPAQPPGTFVYSNAGYMVAAAALELASGESWEQLLKRKLWAPLGMRSCGFGPPGRAGQLTEPWGHTTNRDGSLTAMDPGNPGADNPPSLGPAGTAHCSLVDWGKFLALHLAGARGEPTPLVRTETLQHLQKPAAGGDYAEGWNVVPKGGSYGTVLTHSGSNTLWYVTAWLAPEKNLAVVTATNVASPEAKRQLNAALLMLVKAYAP